jgi:hypothetical protein
MLSPAIVDRISGLCPPSPARSGLRAAAVGLDRSVARPRSVEDSSKAPLNPSYCLCSIKLKGPMSPQ